MDNSSINPVKSKILSESGEMCHIVLSYRQLQSYKEITKVSTYLLKIEWTSIKIKHQIWKCSWSSHYIWPPPGTGEGQNCDLTTQTNSDMISISFIHRFISLEWNQFLSTLSQIGITITITEMKSEPVIGIFLVVTPAGWLRGNTVWVEVKKTAFEIPFLCLILH